MAVFAVGVLLGRGEWNVIYNPRKKELKCVNVFSTHGRKRIIELTKLFVLLE